MKILQISTTVSYGDGVSNDIFALQNVILRMGFQTAVYVENIDGRFFNNSVHHISDLPQLDRNDIILYHLSTGTNLNYKLNQFSGRKVVIYHNITPPEFFSKYNPMIFRACRNGLNGMKYLADTAEYCLADSEFNRQDLISAGYGCRIDVLPIVIPFEDYMDRPDQRIIDMYSQDDYTNILFTGRIAPNKKQEDIISAFYYYHKYYNSKSRLFLVGSYLNMENYYQRLQDFTDELELDSVYFTGHIKFSEILAYYRVADAFVCMSEHEGFCIPLIEAMFFDIPILAYDSSAVTETLGGGGFLTDSKDALVNASILNRMMTDEKLKKTILENQRERLKDFGRDKIEEKFKDYIGAFIEKNER